MSERTTADIVADLRADTAPYVGTVFDPSTGVTHVIEPSPLLREAADRLEYLDSQNAPLDL